jgi:restriction endonuclease
MKQRLKGKRKNRDQNGKTNYIIWLTIVRSAKYYHEFLKMRKSATQVLDDIVIPVLTNIICEYLNPFSKRDQELLNHITTTRSQLQITTDLNVMSSVGQEKDIDVFALRQYDLRILSHNTRANVFDVPVLRCGVSLNRSTTSDSRCDIRSFGFIKK